MKFRTTLSLLTLGLAAGALQAGDHEARVQNAKAHLLAQREALGLDGRHDFQLLAAHTDELGQTHAHFQQTYLGVKVFEGQVITHTDAEGSQRALTQAHVGGLNLNPVPALAESEALAIAHRTLAPKAEYALVPTAELVIYNERVSEQRTVLGREKTITFSRPTLAYHVHAEIEGDEQTAHLDYLINAHTGAVIKQWDTLHTAAATGTGKSEYSGTVALNTNSTSTGFELRDMTRGSGGTYGNNVVINLNKRTSGGSIYTDADNTWGDGANYSTSNSTTSANGQTAAVDAAYGAQTTWDFYKNVFGRNGIDKTGKATYSKVHYSRAYDNAFWSDSCFCMTYGDGSTFKVLTALDVAGHEMSHGVCANSVPGGLTYSGESGGLNEGNSDILGTMVEFYRAGGASGATVPNYTAVTATISTPGGTVPFANYLIGEQLETSSFNHPLRWMYKPSLDGASADSWSSTVGSKDVHYSSGVANHFFFLLAHGSQVDAFSGNIQSPMANGVTSITGLGNDKAARIWYRALNTYFTSGTTYAQARTATLNAAADLYGSGSVEYATVNTAWKAVNVQ